MDGDIIVVKARGSSSDSVRTHVETVRGGDGGGGSRAAQMQFSVSAGRGPV